MNYMLTKFYDDVWIWVRCAESRACLFPIFLNVAVRWRGMASVLHMLEWAWNVIIQVAPAEKYSQLEILNTCPFYARESAISYLYHGSEGPREAGVGKPAISMLTPWWNSMHADNVFVGNFMLNVSSTIYRVIVYSINALALCIIQRGRICVGRLIWCFKHPW